MGRIEPVKEKSGGTMKMRVIRANGNVEDHGVVSGGTFMQRFMSKFKRIIGGY